MEDKNREVFMAISNAARYMDPFFKIGAMGTIILIQYFLRMVKEKKLEVTEFTDFQKFLKATEGKYDIMNVPSVDEGKLKTDLDNLGIRYSILPDLEKNDGMLQVAIYQPDREKFGAWYQRHIMNQMTGGEKELRELKNLTAGKTTIVSFPLEEEEEMIKEDFKTMEINYSSLPDLHVGDGEIQIVVANCDLPKVESWYKLYREDLLKEGVTDIPEMKQMSMDAYIRTGKQTEEEYIDTASPELKAANAKYKGKEKGDIERQIEATKKGKIRDQSSPEYLRYIQDPAYVPISIDRKTLVEKSTVINAEGLAKNHLFSCRVPSTFGNREKQLVIPQGQVFFQRNMDSYIAFLEKEKAPFVYDVQTKHIDSEMRKMTGQEFVKKYFDHVENVAQRKVDPLQKVKSGEKGMGDLQIKMPTSPVRVK